MIKDIRAHASTLRVGARIRVLPGFCYGGELGTITKVKEVAHRGQARWSLLVLHEDGTEVGYCEIDVEVVAAIATGTA